MRRLSVTPLRLVFGALMSLLTLGLPAGGANAHTDFDFSLPTNGAVVGEALSEVTVAFTQPVTLVGNGFEVLDAQGNILLPFAVTDDDALFRLQFDPPLAGGAGGVRYEVTSADGHVVDGSFQFTVSADPPVETTPPTTAPPTTAPPVVTAAPIVTAAPATAAPVTTAPATVASATATVESVVPTTADSRAGDDGSKRGVYVAIAGAVALASAAFLAVRSTTAR